MRWQDILDRERDTDFGRALAAASPSDLEDDGRVVVRASHMASLELRAVDEDALTWFDDGNNVALAWEMHRLSGRPIVFVVPADPHDPIRASGVRWLKVAIEDPSGSWIDIHGLQSAGSVLDDLAWVCEAGVTHVRLDSKVPNQRNFIIDLLADLPGDGIEEKLAARYSEFERGVVRDFARHLMT